MTNEDINKRIVINQQKMLKEMKYTKNCALVVAVWSCIYGAGLFIGLLAFASSL